MSEGLLVSAHQVHYFPWLAYCYKMAVADKFVLADDVQYKSHNFINRTRVKNATGDQWLTVPVLTKGRSGQLIKEVKINNSFNWQRKHWMTIQVNYRAAPFFQMYADFFENLYRRDWTFLVDLNLTTIRFIAKALALNCDFYLSSELELNVGHTKRIVDMVRKLESRRYLSGPSGKKYMDLELFDKHEIEVEYLRYTHPSYRQQFNGFRPNMSIIDLLFNEGPRAPEILLTQPQPAATASARPFSFE